MMQSVAKANDSDESPVRLNAREERARRNLQTFIEESGYSVTQVADLAGIPQATLARYVNGKSAIGFEWLQPLADALGRESIEDFQDQTPARQRTKEELETVQPMFAKSRPGFNPTEQDLADFNEFLRKVQSRRGKKQQSRR